MPETAHQKTYRGSHRKVKSSPMHGKAKRKGMRMVKKTAKSY